MSLRSRALSLLRRSAARRTDGRRRIFFFGDSHVHAIQEALKSRGNDTADVSIEARRLLKHKSIGSGAADSAANVATIGDTNFNEFLAASASLNKTDVLVSLIGGNQHAIFSTMRHPQPFDFYSPEVALAELDPDASVIPFRTLYDYFLKGLRDGDGVTLAALRDATSARVVHLVAPPPKRDNAFIEQHHDTHFASEGIGSLGVSSPELRLKFWHLQNRALAEICRKVGIEMIPPPAAACDADGFLERSCYAGDATHANVRYGELVVSDIERRFA